MKAEEFGLAVDDATIPAAVDQLKARESEGYTYDLAEASLELLLRRAGGWAQEYFWIESYRVHVEERVGDGQEPLAEATVKVTTKGTRHIESAEGQGPVGALDNALRKALANEYPQLDDMEKPPGFPRPRARPERGHGCRRPRADRHVQRRARMDHRRGEQNIIEASWRPSSGTPSVCCTRGSASSD